MVLVSIIFFASMSLVRNGCSSLWAMPMAVASDSSVCACCRMSVMMKLLKIAEVFVSRILLWRLVFLMRRSASWRRACKSLRNPLSSGVGRMSVLGSVISTDEGSASKQKVSSSDMLGKVISSSAKVLKSLLAGCAGS